jgi:prefoldin subunit 5
MDKIQEQQNITLTEKSMEVLIAKFIPTSQYLETKFDHMQYQIDAIKKWQESFEVKMDKRFEQVDKRFEQVDKRFEQIDKRFEQVNDKLDKLLERIDLKIDR